MDDYLEKTLAALRSRHIKGMFAEDIKEANRKIVDLIPPGAIVGFGDSTAVRQLGVLQVLEGRGTKILNAFVPRGAEIGVDDFRRWRERVNLEATLCDVFLTGTNALTQDGKLVNVDASGNRVAGMFWGHPLSIVIVGRNKIVRNLDEAFDRIKNVIAPTHFRIRSGEMGGRKRETPCVATGKCSDCRSKDRGCNVYTIIEVKPARTDLHVIIVNQDLGLGWDPSWPQERIEKIRDGYKKFVWLPV
ncbi:MAG: lactate utilization protein [Proteobacteria bacterium]|nr:lactate utilization protein [Pseudomonadota bacterium]